MAGQHHNCAEPAAGTHAGGTGGVGLAAGHQQEGSDQHQAVGRDRQRDLPTPPVRRVLGGSRPRGWRRRCAGRTGAVTICGADGEDADRDGGAENPEQDCAPHSLLPHVRTRR
jgi:hypothetical protein